MTRLLRVAFLFVLLLLLLWLAAIALLGTSPAWLARSRFGEQAYAVLIVLGSTGLRAFPLLVSMAVLLGAAWLWRRRPDRGARSPSQCQRPSGWTGRIVLWSMNRRHARLTDWGLGHLAIRAEDTCLDVGCGGGRTVARLASLAGSGTVHGIDYAPASIAAARRMNRQLVARGRVHLQEASASALPFTDGTFDLVTAVETHFWWQDLAGGMREAFRVLKPGGRMAVIAEFYNGGRHASYAARLAELTSIALLDVDEHLRMFTTAGFSGVTVDEDAGRGWLCVIGAKPSERGACESS